MTRRRGGREEAGEKEEVQKKEEDENLYLEHKTANIKRNTLS